MRLRGFLDLVDCLPEIGLNKGDPIPPGRDAVALAPGTVKLPSRVSYAANSTKPVGLSDVPSAN